ncbi:choice-of-anchor I family protein [Youngiibacter fragilis]|uniref:5'-nucleotidase n=1 Tax=Youngiibacter fragilis 232.1 TaxID=994573 RepID=V7HYK8_9CLOT|nr:choice-of-anchor I family protein [Youngiibacter fragilis]ETA79070.1 5'-nucleotidase [Youngiibacter fragilis 232.1]
MKKLVSMFSAALFACSVFALDVKAEIVSVADVVYPGSMDVILELAGRYDSGSGDGGAVFAAYADKAEKLFVVNSAEKALDIVDLSDAGDDFELDRTRRIEFDGVDGLGQIGEITSVVVDKKESFIAVSVTAALTQDNGWVVFLDMKGNVLKVIGAGSKPGMMTLTPDNNTLLVANEGEPDTLYTADPEGSVTIIDVRNGVRKASAVNVGFTGVPVEETVRMADPSSTWEQSFEPEHITVSRDSKTAYVSLQESNALAVLDLKAMEFTGVFDMGVKDHSLPDSRLDASDKDNINIAQYPVLGMYMPDDVELVTVKGKEYLLTANEGAWQNYGTWTDWITVNEIKADGLLGLDASQYEGLGQAAIDAMVAASTFKDGLGRMKVSRLQGIGGDGKYDVLYSFGGRSFSILDAKNMEIVYDSGDELEEITAKSLYKYFNASSEDAARDIKSDENGPAPQALATGQIGKSTYAFIGLGEIGGVATYCLDDITDPEFVSYSASRDFTGNKDSGPTDLIFVDADKSPTGEALLAVTCEASGTVALYEIHERKEKMITILHTNDQHARVTPGDGLGMARVASLKDEFAGYGNEVLLLDVGDVLHGTTFATLEKGESVVRVMNEVGYDAMTPGNHDFNYGKDRLLELAGMAEFDIISSNIAYEDGASFLKPYVIKEVDGIRVAIFGLTSPETYYKTLPSNVEGLNINDPVTTAKMMMAMLEPISDIQIALTHLGTDESTEEDERSTAIAMAVEGIDLILDGHSHSVFEYGKVVNGTMIASAGEYNKNVGVVNLLVGKKGVDVLEPVLVNVAASTAIMGDSGVTAIISEINAGQADILKEVVGYSNVILDGIRDNVRSKETNLGNLIADAMLEKTGAELAFMNGGGIRSSINIGDITLGEVITALPFGNYVETRKYTGSIIKAALEHSVEFLPGTAGSFLQVGGITFDADTSKEAGSRVSNIMIAGMPIEEAKEYTAALNNFLGAGGDGYTMFIGSPVLIEYPALDEILIEYLNLHSPVAPAVEGRINVIS